MHKQVLLIATSCILSCSLTQSALAVKNFQIEFYRVYKIDSKAEKPTGFAKAVLEAKCYLCHKGKKKKNRNPYGEQLEKLLDRKKDSKNPEKIAEAIQKVAKLHVDPKNKKSPTYGERIKAGKLPGGPLEEAKKEPAEKK
ncbi:MAG: hypothetical protein CMJ72_11285 [Planctomycetaceae bacterium]|jgi:cytochrome c2|nr:hypothetical protein [Planctomycetaceae bacterium]HCK40764.1 hypothetical protein [Planctomycetaceae bacterium]